MLSDFLHAERLELIERCRTKVLRRPNAAGTQSAVQHGVAELLDQLIRTLRMEAMPANGEGDRRSGISGASSRSDLGESAASHGRELFLRGYSVEAVVHGYGDLCQAVTELADERQVAIEVREFRTLNRCLDNAIAEAVKAYAYGDKLAGETAALALKERHGSFVHEIRNHLGTAMLAFSLVRDAHVTPNGATGAIVNRSLRALSDLVERGIVETRTGVAAEMRNEPISLARFIADTCGSAMLQAEARGCKLTATEVDPTLAVEVDAVLLSGALLNLLENAFKFTSPGTTVRLEARAAGDRILISVTDQCGGIRAEAMNALFRPFVQHDANRTGLGLGLSICRKYVESCGGTLACRNDPGKGCTFTIDLPRHRLQPSPHASPQASAIADAPGPAP